MNILANYPPNLKQQSFIPVDSSQEFLKIEYEDLASQYDYVQANFRDIETNKPIEGHNNNIQAKPSIQQPQIYKIKLNSSLNGFAIFPTGKVHKGQIRFVNSNDPNNITSASEWSGWFLFKRIGETNQNIFNISLDSTQSPVVKGTITRDGEIWFNNNLETINKYKYLIYSANPVSGEKENLLEESNWIQAEANSPMSYQVRSRLQLGQKYKIIFRIQTKNLYEFEEDTLYTPSNIVTDSEINMKIEAHADPEEGTINIFLSQLDPNGESVENLVYAISRSSNKNNYKEQELLTEIVFEKEGLFYTDYTVEDGVKYKYSVQRVVSAAGARGGFRETEEVEAKLNYTYLWDGNAQLKLKFNNSLSSIKRNILTQKQDTIGGKYPTIYRNGVVNYLEFPVSGLISLHLDENNKFFQFQEDGYYYKNELIIPIEKFKDPVTKEILGFNTNLTPNNIYIERKFREKVEEFLNEPTEKLYRSPTEGNIMIYLAGASFSPNQQLGRMISEFSATAYEVSEPTIEHMRELLWIKSEFTKQEREQFLIFKQFSLDHIKILEGNQSLNSQASSYIKALVPEAVIKSIHIDTVTAVTEDTIITLTYADGEVSDIRISKDGVYYANTEVVELKADKTVLLTGYTSYSTDPFPDNIQFYTLFSGYNQYYNGEGITNTILEEDNLLDFLREIANKSIEPDLINTGFTITKAIFGDIEIGTKLDINGKQFYYNGDVNDHIFNEEITSMKLLDGTLKSIYFEYYGYQPTSLSIE